MNIQKIMNISLSFVPKQGHSNWPTMETCTCTRHAQLSANDRSPLTPVRRLFWACGVISRGPSCNVKRVEFLIDFEGWSLLRMWTDLYFFLDRPLVDVPVKEWPNHANTFYFQINRHWLSSVDAIWPSRSAALYGRASWTLMKWNSCPKINCKYHSN